MPQRRCDQPCSSRTVPGTRLPLIQLRRGGGEVRLVAHNMPRGDVGGQCRTAVGADGFLLLEGLSFRGFVRFKAGGGGLLRRGRGSGPGGA